MLTLPTTTIQIDIEVYRAIETHRTSFDQTPNDILRELVDIGSPVDIQTDEAGESPAQAQGEPIHRIVRNRRTGVYGFDLMGKHFEEMSLREAYKRCLMELATMDGQFLEKLAERRTRARRIVARDPRDLYLRTPKLAEKFADRLIGPWWFDVNLSQEQVENRVEIACDVAGLQFGEDLKLEFPEPIEVGAP